MNTFTVTYKTLSGSVKTMTVTASDILKAQSKAYSRVANKGDLALIINIAAN